MNTTEYEKFIIQLEDSGIRPFEILLLSNEEISSKIHRSILDINAFREMYTRRVSKQRPASTTLNTNTDFGWTSKIPTGIYALDMLLNGGIVKSQLTEIFGPAGSGKTCLCSQIAIQAKSTLFITTELPTEHIRRKLMSIAKPDNPLLQKITICRASSAAQLRIILTKVKFMNPKPECLIIDSIAYIYYQNDNNKEHWRDLQLKKLAFDYNIAILVVNQVRDVRVNELDNKFGYEEQWACLDGTQMSNEIRKSHVLDTNWGQYVDARYSLFPYQDLRKFSVVFSKSCDSNSINLEMSEDGLSVVFTNEQLSQLLTPNQ